mmetsp:Transcript_6302/g.9164  ORF Transcript_6302/g.9164 Transcript_6302/m.9164 type:complete len:527 (-) Transcript_6302:404-1984(-)
MRSSTKKTKKDQYGVLGDITDDVLIYMILNFLNPNFVLYVLPRVSRKMYQLVHQKCIFDSIYNRKPVPKKIQNKLMVSLATYKWKNQPLYGKNQELIFKKFVYSMWNNRLQFNEICKESLLKTLDLNYNYGSISFLLTPQLIHPNEFQLRYLNIIISFKDVIEKMRRDFQKKTCSKDRYMGCRTLQNFFKELYIHNIPKISRMYSYNTTSLKNYKSLISGHAAKICGEVSRQGADLMIKVKTVEFIELTDFEIRYDFTKKQLNNDHDMGYARYIKTLTGALIDATLRYKQLKTHTFHGRLIKCDIQVKKPYNGSMVSGILHHPSVSKMNRRNILVYKIDQGGPLSATYHAFRKKYAGPTSYVDYTPQVNDILRVTGRFDVNLNIFAFDIQLIKQASLYEREKFSIYRSAFLFLSMLVPYYFHRKYCVNKPPLPPMMNSGVRLIHSAFSNLTSPFVTIGLLGVSPVYFFKDVAQYIFPRIKRVIPRVIMSVLGLGGMVSTGYFVNNALTYAKSRDIIKKAGKQLYIL